MASKAYNIAFKLGAKLDKTYGNTFGKAESIASKTVTSIKRALAGLAAVVISFSAVQGAVNEAMKFESAMADVAKVVDGLKDETGKTTDAYAVMSEEILDMTARLPMAAEDITKLIAAAGQSGIAADELTRFAEDAAKMGVAFDLPAEKAGELAAVIRSSLGMTQDEFVVLADKINYFGNTTTQSADKIIETVQATGLIGKQAGVSADQIAAMSAAMNGMDASNMGTALSNIYGSLMTGSGATKAAQQAWKSLGFTSEQVAKSMLEDSEGTMIRIFEAMKNLPADQLAATTGAIFGNNKSTKMAVAAFTENLDVLKQNFNSIGDATIYAGSMQDEFNSRAATTENTIQLAKNAIDRLKITLGNLLLPAVAKGANLFADAMSSLSKKVVPLLSDKIERLKPHLTSLFNTGKEMAEIFRAKINGLRPSLDNLKRVFDAVKSVVFAVGNSISIAFTGKALGTIGSFESGLDKLISIVNSLTDGLARVAEFIQNNWSVIGPIVLGIVSAMVSLKVISMGISAVLGAIRFVKMAKDIAVATKAFFALTKAKLVDKAQTLYLMALYAKDAIVRGASTVAQWAQVAATTAWNVVAGIGAAVTTAFGAAVAFLTSPIGLVVLAIGALIAIVVLLVKNWDTVKAKAVEVWQTIQNAFGNVGTWFKERFLQAQEAFQNFMGNLSERFPMLYDIISVPIEAIKGCIAGLKQFFGGIIDFVAGVFTGNWERAWQGVQDIFSGIFGALGSIVKAPMNAIISIINGAISGINSLNITIPDWVPFGLGGKTFGLNIPEIPLLAKGSNNAPDTFIAGERGPELITGAQGSKVFTANQTSGIFDRIAQAIGNIGRYDNLDSPQGDSPLSLAPGGSDSYYGSPIEIVYNPQIKIDGARQDEDSLRRLIEELLQKHSQDVEQIVRDVLDSIRSREERLANV